MSETTIDGNDGHVQNRLHGPCQQSLKAVVARADGARTAVPKFLMGSRQRGKPGLCELLFLRGRNFWLDAFSPPSILPPSSTMLTSRGTVARLSKRAFNSAKKTNAFFSSAAVLPRLAVPASTQQKSANARPSRAAAPAPGSYTSCFWSWVALFTRLSDLSYPQLCY
jgi:hypothetical protein